MHLACEILHNWRSSNCKEKDFKIIIIQSLDLRGKTHPNQRKAPNSEEEGKKEGLTNKPLPLLWVPSLRIISSFNKVHNYAISWKPTCSSNLLLRLSLPSVFYFFYSVHTEVKVNVTLELSNDCLVYYGSVYEEFTNFDQGSRWVCSLTFFVVHSLLIGLHVHLVLR